MKYHIVADTSCDLFTLPECPPGADFATVPFSIRIGDREFIDDVHMPVDEMLEANENHGVAAQTSCPSPQDWLDRFSAPGPVVAFTISSALSGSYNSACSARDMLREEQPDKEIAIIDSKATGPEIILLIRRACDLIRQGLPFKHIERDLIDTAARTHILFALASYHNLVRAGRVSRLVGLIAGTLHLWGIGIGDENGKIAMRGKARGQKNMVRAMAEEIQKIGVSGKEIVISHCQNEEGALALKALLTGHKVDIFPTRGLDSFYAERRGLIVGF